MLSEAYMQKHKPQISIAIGRIFSDEVIFWAWVRVKRAWYIHGTNFIQRTVKHHIKVNMWGCFAERTFGCLELFTKNLNAEKMSQMYNRGFLRSANKIIINNKDWILQEDNDNPEPGMKKIALFLSILSISWYYSHWKCMDHNEGSACKEACLQFGTAYKGYSEDIAFLFHWLCRKTSGELP